MTNAERNKGIVGLYRNINEKLRNVEIIGAGVLGLFGQWGWAGVLAFAAGIDHAQVKVAEWLQNRGQSMTKGKEYKLST